MSVDFEFLLYEEAASRLGISIDSVRKQARRKAWPRKPGNDGKVRVGIPLERLAADSPKDNPPDRPEDSPGAIRELQARVLELQGQLLAAEARQEGQERLISALQSDRDAWEAHAKRPFWRRLVA